MNVSNADGPVVVLNSNLSPSAALSTDHVSVVRHVHVHRREPSYAMAVEFSGT